MHLYFNYERDRVQSIHKYSNVTYSLALKQSAPKESYQVHISMTMVVLFYGQYHETSNLTFIRLLIIIVVVKLIPNDLKLSPKQFHNFSP